MPIADVLNVSISVSGAGPTRAGFGEPMIVAYHTQFTDRSREYASLSGVAVDFPVTHPAYLIAQEVFAQQPAPENVKIGRRALPTVQVLHVVCLSTVATDVYNFNLRTPGGSWRNINVPSTGVPATDVATINTAVTALSIPNLTATHASVTLTLTMAAGHLLDVQPDYVHCTFADATSDPGIATDLVAIKAADSSWYGLLLDSQSPAEIAAAAVWTESNGKQFAWNSSDTACGDPSSTTDIFYTEQALAHERSFGIFSQGQLLSYVAAGWMGRLFPTDPGSENWAFKTIAGAPVDNLTDAQIHAIEAKNGSVYTKLFGLNLTQFGKTPGGEWADIVRGTDALTNDLQVAVLALQANTLKVPFTDGGADLYRSAITAVLKSYEDVGFIAETPAFTVTIPKVATVSPTNKAARNFPGMSFAAELAGAINGATLNGVLTS